MKKYKRIEIEVMADQFWPGKKMDIPGFKNIVERVLEPGTYTERVICERGEIVSNGKVHSLNRGDWVLVFPDESIQVDSISDFDSNFKAVDK